MTMYSFQGHTFYRDSDGDYLVESAHADRVRPRASYHNIGRNREAVGLTMDMGSDVQGSIIEAAHYNKEEEVLEFGSMNIPIRLMSNHVISAFVLHQNEI